MKKLSQKNAEILLDQCLRGIQFVPGLIPEKTNQEWAIEGMRRIYDHPETSADKKNEIAILFSSMDIPLEPTEDEVRYRTSLYQKVMETFSTTYGLLEARTGNNPKEVAEASRKIDNAQ